MSLDVDERLTAELSLLESMYPEQVTWDSRARELKYQTDRGAFMVRLPDTYLSTGLPYVVSANIGKVDVSEVLRQNIKECAVDEEILDSVVSSFDETIANTKQIHHEDQSDEMTANSKDGLAVEAKATVVVWLHHLLNTNKRKQALSPNSQEVSGITKPGYPGVLVYSGPATAVYEHVNELKQLNWQAFQIRLESDEQWIFKHGDGVREFEAMKDIVAGIGEGKKEVFMESMRMK